MDDVINLNFADELRIEGVKCKGYGILPKYVMLDPDLTIEAKGIYAYFCSFAGSGNTAFPCRDKIIADLQINKDTYYKHFNVIISQGYISVEQAHAHGGRGNGFTKNIYTLISNPKKFEDNPEDSKHNQAYVRIRFGGLESAGFGFIPKAVMLDNRLPLKAKAIYAYFCGFTGSGNAAFPKKERMLFHLGISHNTYQKCYKLLTELNYITVVQRHIDGRLTINDYYLNDKPNEEKATNKKIVNVLSQSTNFSDTQKTAGTIQCTNFSDTQKTAGKIQCTNFSDAQKQDAQKQDTQKPDTNINNIRINNSYYNQSIHQQAAQPLYPAKPEKPDGWIDGVSETEFFEKIEDELLIAGTLPYHFLADDKKLTAAIRYLTEWELRNEQYNNLQASDKNTDLQHKVFNLFVEALIEMLTPSSQPMKLKGLLVTYSKVYDRLVMYIKQGNYHELYIENIEDAAAEGFIRGCRNTEIRNHLQYMKACIWTALQTGEIGVLAQIEHDLG